MEDKNLHIEQFESTKIETKISYPNHFCICGPTQSGKSHLIASILDNIDQVFSFQNSMSNKKLVIVSPLDRAEIADLMHSKLEWEITLFNVLDFDSDFENQLSECFKISQNDINILLFDDYLVQMSEKQMKIINRIYATYRHMNVSVFSSIHSYDQRFVTVFEQSAMILVLYGFSQITFLRNALKHHFYKGTASIVRAIRNVYEKSQGAHKYLALNFSKRAIASEQYFITDNIFNPSKGIVLKQILNKLIIK